MNGFVLLIMKQDIWNSLAKDVVLTVLSRSEFMAVSDDGENWDVRKDRCIIPSYPPYFDNFLDLIGRIAVTVGVDLHKPAKVYNFGALLGEPILSIPLSVVV